MKICSQCKASKPLSEFGKRPERSSGVKSRCKACEAQNAKTYRQKNPEAWGLTKRRSYEKHADDVREYSRRYRVEHPERISAYNKKYRAENRDFVAFAMRRWQLAHPERLREIDANRRARKLDAWVEDVDRLVVYERDGGRCHICGESVERKGFHLDHLVPLSCGGEHSYRNVALAHPKCNMSRGAGRIPAQLLLLGRV